MNNVYVHEEQKLSQRKIKSEQKRTNFLLVSCHVTFYECENNSQKDKSHLEHCECMKTEYFRYKKKKVDRKWLEIWTKTVNSGRRVAYSFRLSLCPDGHL